MSVVVPIYDAEDFIKQCMSSILAQTLKDIEIVLVDDGSKDNCPQIIDEYEKQDKRIVVIHQPNSGYGVAVNRGIDVATGEYIGIVEPDDWIEQNMFEVLYQKAIESGADFVKSGFYKYRGNKNTNEVAHLFSVEVLNLMVRPRDHMDALSICPCIWTAIYRKEFLVRNKIRLLETPGASYQDIGFYFKSFLMAENACFLRQPFYHYRIDNTASSVRDIKKVFCVCDEWTEIVRWTKERGIYDKISGRLCALQYNTYMWNWKRLRGGIKDEFLQRFSKDFKLLNSAGIIKKEYFKEKNYKRLQEIMFHPRRFSFFYRLKHLPHTVLNSFKG